MDVLSELAGAIGIVLKTVSCAAASSEVIGATVAGVIADDVRSANSPLLSRAFHIAISSTLGNTALRRDFDDSELAAEFGYVNRPTARHGEYMSTEMSDRIFAELAHLRRELANVRSSMELHHRRMSDVSDNPILQPAIRRYSTKRFSSVSGDQVGGQRHASDYQQDARPKSIGRRTLSSLLSCHAPVNPCLKN
jgi:hypothetical protein